HNDAERGAPVRVSPAPQDNFRLSLKTLRLASKGVRRPAFDIARTRTGILHLGCGVFHRAHQAVYTQLAMERADPSAPEWGIVAASLRQPHTRDALARQDGLYTLVERGP